MTLDSATVGSYEGGVSYERGTPVEGWISGPVVSRRFFFFLITLDTILEGP